MNEPTLADGETESLCVLFHDAYEAAAVEAGWETQARSRKPWADVPEANKATMRATIRTVLASDWLAARVAEAVDRERAAWATKIETLADEVDDDWSHADHSGGNGENVLECARCWRDGLRGLLAADDTEGKREVGR